ncbi:hypothetical protein GCM10028784_22740 [Myceligenerans cantabricum]
MARRTTTSPSGTAALLRGRAALGSGPVSDAYASFRLARDLLDDDPHLTLAATLGAADAAWAAGDRGACLAELDSAARYTAAHGPAASRPTPEADLLTDHLAGMRALLTERMAEAVGPLRRVVARGSAGDDPEHLFRATVAALLLGEVRLAARTGARALAAARAHEHDELVARTLEHLAYAEMRAGHHARARAHADEGLRSAVITEQHNTAAHHRAVLALTAAVEGDVDEVAARATEALTTSRRHCLAQTRTLAEWALARADLGAGRAGDAAGRLAMLVSAGPGGGHFAIRALLLPSFVEAAVAAGQADAARPVMAELALWAGFGADSLAPALLARSRALLAGHVGDDGATERHWLQALGLHGADPGDFEQASTRLLYGKWLRRRRRPSDARGQLREALHAFERNGASAWAAQAREELRATGETTGPSSAWARNGAGDGPLARLTPHQQRIARYVADGATNREVASRLSVSVRTVDHHLRNIFATLGVRSRVELARLVAG